MLSLNSMAKKNLHPEANIFVNFIYQNKSKKKLGDINITKRIKQIKNSKPNNIIKKFGPIKVGKV
jgi:hypothetical protein